MREAPREHGGQSAVEKTGLSFRGEVATTVEQIPISAIAMRCDHDRTRSLSEHIASNT